MRSQAIYGLFANGSTILNILAPVATRLVPRSQKDPRSWVRWVQGLVDLDGSWTLHVLFVVGLWKPRTSKLWFAARPWKPRTSRFWYAARPQKTQDLKILIVARPWKPRTLKFGYVAKPRKPRTQNLKILVSRDFKVLGPYVIHWISCWALCQGTQKVMSSDDRTPKTWIVKNNTTLPDLPCRW